MKCYMVYLGIDPEIKSWPSTSKALEEFTRTSKRLGKGISAEIHIGQITDIPDQKFSLLPNGKVLVENSRPSTKRK